MGVQGLVSLLEDYSQIYEDFHFRDSKLLVDGTNLAFFLYDRSNLDQNHGGEYLAFQAKVWAFFRTLENCQIEPYVVMDGGSGRSDFRMGRNRASLKIPHALKGKKMGFYPRFTMTVFEETLNDMRVRLDRCFGEADGQLAALAREWSCPVLSRDSDFYIYDLPEGVLPLDHFQWDSFERSGARRYIPCKKYTTSSFCRVFNIDHQLLTVFAALAANDFDNLRDVMLARYVPAGSPEMKPRTASLVGLLRLLGARTDETTEDTLNAAMALIPNISQQERIEVQTAVQNARHKYRPPSSCLGGKAPLLLVETLSRVPEWIRATLDRGELGAKILVYNILLNRRNNLWIQVERSNLQSSNLTSRPIRQVMYGLLLGQRGGEVEEVDRDGLELVSVKVRPVVQGAAQTLRLDSLPQADCLTLRLQVCLETLGVEEETLEGVPAHLRLPVAVTCYWLRRASPEPTVLKALLMVMVQGELNRRTGGTTGWQGDTHHLSEPLDGVVAHSFNQWQACLKDATQLNLLLCEPLPGPHYAWLYQGRLVHQWQKEFQTKEPEENVKDCLYNVLLEKVCQSGRRAKKRAKKRAQKRARTELLEPGEEDEEEGLSGVQMSLRQRYGTKNRKVQSRIPELGRKQERVGW